MWIYIHIHISYTYTYIYIYIYIIDNIYIDIYILFGSISKIKMMRICLMRFYKPNIYVSLPKERHDRHWRIWESTWSTIGIWQVPLDLQEKNILCMSMVNGWIVWVISGYHSYHHSHEIRFYLDIIYIYIKQVSIIKVSSISTICKSLYQPINQPGFFNWLSWIAHLTSEARKVRAHHHGQATR